MRGFIALLMVCLPLSGMAQSDPAARALEATAMLGDAIAKLEEAQSARDRVRALTGTIVALEEGLTAVRGGLRQARREEAALSAELQAGDAETAALLAVLMQIADGSSPVRHLHPAGPLGTARAGMLLAEMTPALDAQAADLRDTVQSLASARSVQQAAEAQLSAGLVAVQSARSDLNQAIADRVELPKRFINDPVREAILIASADTLAAFAEGLDLVVVDRIAPAPDDLEGQKGALPLPVTGTIALAAGEADAAGVVRSGIVIETAPQAIVTSPVSATVRYIGELLDLGQVVILEPQADVLFVFSGLDIVYGSAGDVVDTGAPLGLMGGEDHKNVAELSTDSDETGAGRRERLYIEIRQDNTPEDPSLWFRLDKDG